MSPYNLVLESAHLSVLQSAAYGILIKPRDNWALNRQLSEVHLSSTNYLPVHSAWLAIVFTFEQKWQFSILSLLKETQVDLASVKSDTVLRLS